MSKSHNKGFPYQLLAQIHLDSFHLLPQHTLMDKAILPTHQYVKCIHKWLLGLKEWDRWLFYNKLDEWKVFTGRVEWQGWGMLYFISFQFSSIQLNSFQFNSIKLNSFQFILLYCIAEHFPIDVGHPNCAQCFYFILPPLSHHGIMVRTQLRYALFTRAVNTPMLLSSI